MSFNKDHFELQLMLRLKQLETIYPVTPQEYQIYRQMNLPSDSIHMTKQSINRYRQTLIMYLRNLLLDQVEHVTEPLQLEDLLIYQSQPEARRQLLEELNLYLQEWGNKVPCNSPLPNQLNCVTRFRTENGRSMIEFIMTLAIHMAELDLASRTRRGGLSTTQWNDMIQHMIYLIGSHHNLLYLDKIQ